MTSAGWERTYFKPGGGDAHVAWFFFGDFAAGLELSKSKHRTLGIPDGVGVEARATSAIAELLGSPLGAQLDEQLPGQAAAVRGAPGMLVLHGTIPDPADLEYLRDLVGVAMALLEQGGIAMLDQQLRFWSAAAWREQLFREDRAQPTKLVSIHVSDGWYHTRGLRLFGRPDLSAHGVTESMQTAAIEMLNRLIGFQARGGIVPESQPVKMAGIPADWVCQHRGSPDDPDFNNTHIELGPRAG